MTRIVGDVMGGLNEAGAKKQEETEKNGDNDRRPGFKTISGGGLRQGFPGKRLGAGWVCLHHSISPR